MASVSVAPVASTSTQVLRTKRTKPSRTSSAAAAGRGGGNGTVSKKARKPPLGKLLASSDKQVREDAVDHLLVFLSGKGDLEDSEKQDLDQDTEGTTLKATVHEQDSDEEWDSVKLPKAFQDEPLTVLWQGCFYCMYMCDKPLPQQKLAHQLAEPIVSVLENPRLKSKTARRKASLAYLSTFWKTMTREMPGVDRHRMDKYYSLMRQVLHNTFVLLRKTGWNERAVQIANSFLVRQGGPMHLQDSKTPISVAYHILDIYLTELSKSLHEASDGEEDSSSSSPVPILSLLEPFIEILAVVNSKAHFQRVVANVFEPLLDMIESADKNEDRPRKRSRVEEAENGATEENELLLRDQPDDLKTIVLQRLFDKGAEDSTDPVNRKRLYKFAADHGLE